MVVVLLLWGNEMAGIRHVRVAVSFQGLCTSALGYLIMQPLVHACATQAAPECLRQCRISLCSAGKCILYVDSGGMKGKNNCNPWKSVLGFVKSGRRELHVNMLKALSHLSISAVSLCHCSYPN